jgi:acetyl esterase/lipase
VLDVYVPPADGPVPVVVWIHGGGWLDGDRRYPPPTVPSELLFGSILKAGLAVVTIDYRHSLEKPFPAQLHDVKAAIRYVRRFAGDLGIDASRLGVWGESAGGHLAALAGLVTPEGLHGEALEGTEGITTGSSGVQAVVDWYGVSDIDAAISAFPAPFDATGLPNPYDSLLGGTPDRREELARIASPVTYADQPAPPFLLVHGTKDNLVPYAQSEVLAERLRAQGGIVELNPVVDADHIFLGSSDVAGIVARGVEFLARHLA